VPPSLGSAFITPLAGGPPLPQLAAAHKEQIFVLYSHLGSVEINSILPAPPGGGMGRAGRMPFLTTAMPRSEGVGSPLLCPSNLPPPSGALGGPPGGSPPDDAFDVRRIDLATLDPDTRARIMELPRGGPSQPLRLTPVPTAPSFMG